MLRKLTSSKIGTNFRNTLYMNVSLFCCNFFFRVIGVTAVVSKVFLWAFEWELARGWPKFTPCACPMFYSYIVLIQTNLCLSFFETPNKLLIYNVKLIGPVIWTKFSRCLTKLRYEISWIMLNLSSGYSLCEQCHEGRKLAIERHSWNKNNPIM